jgi:hypothetical protein
MIGSETSVCFFKPFEPITVGLASFSALVSDAFYQSNLNSSI